MTEKPSAQFITKHKDAAFSIGLTLIAFAVTANAIRVRPMLKAASLCFVMNCAEGFSVIGDAETFCVYLCVLRASALSASCRKVQPRRRRIRRGKRRVGDQRAIMAPL